MAVESLVGRRELTLAQEAARGFPSFNVLDRIERKRGAVVEIHTFLEGHHPELLVLSGGRLRGDCINNGWCPGGKETHIIQTKITTSHTFTVR